MSPKKHSYPWTELYNLESQLGQKPLPGIRRRGRPPRPFQRLRVQLLMTDEEQRVLQRLRNTLEEQLQPARITRSQANGLALRLLVCCFTNTLTYNERGCILPVDEQKSPTHRSECA